MTRWQVFFGFQVVHDEMQPRLAFDAKGVGGDERDGFWATIEDKQFL